MTSPGTGSGEGFLAGGISEGAAEACSSLGCFLPVNSVLLTVANFADNFRHLARSSADLSRSTSSRICVLPNSRRSRAFALEAMAESTREAADTEDGAKWEPKSSKIGVSKAVLGSISGDFSAEDVKSFGVP